MRSNPSSMRAWRRPNSASMVDPECDLRITKVALRWFHPQLWQVKTTKWRRVPVPRD